MHEHLWINQKGKQNSIVNKQRIWIYTISSPNVQVVYDIFKFTNKYKHKTKMTYPLTLMYLANIKMVGVIMWSYKTSFIPFVALENTFIVIHIKSRANYSSCLKIFSKYL